jgi:hypothetical protein
MSVVAEGVAVSAHGPAVAVESATRILTAPLRVSGTTNGEDAQSLNAGICLAGVVERIREMAGAAGGVAAV